jgi:hypothetical protein
MRACGWVLLLVGIGCRPPAHVDLSLAMDSCEASAGNPPAPPICAALTLDCANFVEVRLYESDGQGTLGPILGSNCLTTAQLGQPPDLCALQMSRVPLPLLTNLPDGKTVRFRIRALAVADGTARCNVDLPGAAVPTLVFDAFSAPVKLDGNDHRVVVELGVCGSCGIAGALSCEELSVPPDCVLPGKRCPNGKRPLFVPGGCCGFCDPT